MARLKFLLFALVVLVLWASQLFFLAPAVSHQALEAALGTVQMTPSLLGARVDARRLDLQKVALKVAGSPALVAALPLPKKGADEEAPDAERFRQVRAAVAPGVPESLRPGFVLGVLNAQGAILSRGEEDPKPLPRELDVAALTKAGGEGWVHEAFGLPYLFYSFPVSSTDRSGEVKDVGRVVVGAPLLSEEAVKGAVKEGSLAAVAVMMGGKRTALAGPEAALLDAAEQALKPGQTAVVSQGEVSVLGPMKLPLLTSSDDTLGGRAPLAVATRQVLGGTPYEVLGVASLKPAQQTLAGFQRMTLFGFLGLLGLSILFALLLVPSAQAATGVGKPAEEGQEGLAPHSAEPPALGELSFEPLSPAITDPPGTPGVSGEVGWESPSRNALPPDSEPPLQPMGGADFGPPAASGPWEAASPPPVSQEDGEWNAPPPGGTPWEPPSPDAGATPWDTAPTAPPDWRATAPSVTQQDFASPPPENMPFEPPPPVPMAAPAPGGVPSFDTLTTRAYPIPQAALDSLAQGPGLDAIGATAPFGGNPETTRVTQIPDELLRAAGSIEPFPMSAVTDSPPLDAEEQHFQEVFRDFVTTREQCGEPADGLTYEKFVQKLRKNKDQLVAKYNCKTVRFTVYVKEGKAALKATPLRE